MSVFRWIRDLLGIRKDRIDTKKSKLEVEILQKETGKRVKIEKADLEDIKKYDNKTRGLFSVLQISHSVYYIMIIMIIVALLIFIIKKVFF